MDTKYNTEQVPDGQVRMVIRLNGMLDEARLGRAVRLAFDAEPVLGCRLIERPLRPYWQRCAGLESAFEFHPVDPSDYDKVTSDYLLAPLDPFKGPQVRVCLFRHGFDTLCIKMGHIVADGGASVEYVRLLSNIYRRLEIDPEYRPASNLHGSRSSFQALRHVGLKKILAACTHVPASRLAWGFPRTGNGKASPSIFIRRVGHGHLSRIKAYARDHGVTVGDILVTAFYRALFEVINPPENVPLPLLVSVNLRKHIPGGRGEGICSLSSGYFPEIVRKKSEPFEETLARVHAVMERYKSQQVELGQLFLMELAFAPGLIVTRILGPYLSSALAIPEFSNIGPIDPGIADFGDITIREILSLGSLASPPNILAGASTFNGEMAITSLVYGNEDHVSRVESLFEAMARELPGYGQDEAVTVGEEATAAHEATGVNLREKCISDA